MLTGKDGDQLSISAVDFSSGHSPELILYHTTHNAFANQNAMQCSAMDAYFAKLYGCLYDCTITHCSAHKGEGKANAAFVLFTRLKCQHQLDMYFPILRP